MLNSLASEILRRFGGPQQVAALLGIPQKTVTNWGYNHNIPGRWHLRLMREADDRGIFLKAHELEEASTPPKPRRQAVG